MVARLIAIVVAFALLGGVTRTIANIDEAAEVAVDAPMELAGPPAAPGLLPPIASVVDVVHVQAALTPRLHVMGVFRPPQR